MKYRISLLCFICSLFSICGCHDSDKENGLLKSIKLSNYQDNVLRVKIEMEYSSDCMFSILYWSKSDPTVVTKTKLISTSSCKGEAVLMFLYPEEEYQFKVNSGSSSSDVYEFKTGKLPSNMDVYSLKKYSDKSIPGYIFSTQANKAGYMMLSDTDGRLVWYQEYDQAVRPFNIIPEDGLIWFLSGFHDGEKGSFQRVCDRIVCMDFYGDIKSTWTVENDGFELRYPHHEVRHMPDGSVAVVANFTREYDLTPVGGKPETTIFGDGYAILDKGGKMISSWNILDHIDIFNCDYVNPLIYSSDLVHANSFNYDSEGNYYMTFNHSSQLWKIDSKTGEVLYRVGPRGNVKMDEAANACGLHAAIPLAPDRVLCLDNGSDIGISRAVIYKVNPSDMTCELELDVRLPGIYASRDRSNVELICNETMLMFGMTQPKTVVFTDIEGNMLRALKRSTISYRAIYLDSLPTL